MTLPHDCTARLNQLRETIEKNKENLVDHDVELELKNERTSLDKKTA